MDTKTFSRVEIKDASKGLVTAVISTFGVIDHDGDVTAKSTFTDGAPVIVSAYGHTSWDGNLPVGKGAIRTTDTEAIADLQFFLGTTHGRDAFETVKELSAAQLQQWSYSLENTVSKRGTLDGLPANFLESTDVTEVSPVLRGASINTRTLSVKQQADLTFSEHIDAVVADVDVLIARASEVVALRAEKGKGLAPERVEQLAQLADRLKAFTAPTPTAPTDEDLRAALDAEFLRFVASQGAPTS